MFVGIAASALVAIVVLATMKHTSDLRVERDEKQHALDELGNLTGEVDDPGEGERVLFPHKGAIANKCLAKLHAQTQKAVAVAVTVRVRGAASGVIEAVTPIGMPPSFDVLDCVARTASAIRFRATQSGFAFTTTIEFTDTR